MARQGSHSGSLLKMNLNAFEIQSMHFIIGECYVGSKSEESVRNY